MQQVTGYAPECSRTASSNEIMISLLSICKFAPWVNHVHLAADEQSFPLHFLDEKCREKVSFVDLADFIPSQYLPTFNSHVIEAHLHLIPGLTEHFLYLNDDMILGRPLSKASLMSATHGIFKAQVQHSDDGQAERWLLYSNISDHPWVHPRRNGAELFQSAFGELPAGHDAHGASALTKSAMKATWTHFNTTLSKTMHNKRRVYATLAHGGDIHVTSLAQQVGVQLGLMQLEEQLQVLQAPPGHPMAQIVDALFGLQHDIICVQGLYLLPIPNFHALCWLVREMWCMPGKHCEAFVSMCVDRPTCDDDLPTHTSLELGIPLLRPATTQGLVNG